MYFPICARCRSKNTLGDEICGSCRITLSVAKVINTIIDRCDGKRTRAMEYVGLTNKKYYFKLLNEIPEISEAWEGSDDVPDILMDNEQKTTKPRKIVGTNILNEATQQEYDWFYKKIFRETDYTRLPNAKQEEFINWLWSVDLNRLSIKDARAKLLEYNIDKEVIKL